MARKNLIPLSQEDDNLLFLRGARHLSGVEVVGIYEIVIGTIPIVKLGYLIYPLPMYEGGIKGSSY